MTYRRHNYCLSAGWSSLVARRAHNPKVAGSNPAPATSDQRLTAPNPLNFATLRNVIVSNALLNNHNTKDLCHFLHIKKKSPLVDKEALNNSKIREWP